MNDLLRAATAGSMGTQVQQDDKDLVADVTKLMSLMELLIDTFNDFIIEIHVVPMNIIQLKTSELKYMGFYIVYNGSYTNKLSEMKQTCTDMLTELVKGEFDEIDNIDKIEYHMYEDWKEPSLMLYTVFDKFTIEDLEDNDYAFLYGLVSEFDCAVTIPKTYKFAKMKSVFLHSPSTVMITKLRKFVSSYGERYGIKVSELDNVDNSTNLAYVVMVGLKPLYYDVPYLYVDKMSFNAQRLESILKSNAD